MGDRALHPLDEVGIMPFGKVPLPVHGFDAYPLHQDAHLYSTDGIAFHARKMVEHSAAGKGGGECSIEGRCPARVRR